MIIERIETPRMMIRNFIPEDAADLQEIFGDAETMEYSEPPYDLEKTKQFLASFAFLVAVLWQQFTREVEK